MKKCFWRRGPLDGWNICFAPALCSKTSFPSSATNLRLCAFSSLSPFLILNSPSKELQHLYVHPPSRVNFPSQGSYDTGEVLLLGQRWYKGSGGCWERARPAWRQWWWGEGRGTTAGKGEATTVAGSGFDEAAWEEGRLSLRGKQVCEEVIRTPRQAHTHTYTHTPSSHTCMQTNKHTLQIQRLPKKKPKKKQPAHSNFNTEIEMASLQITKLAPVPAPNSFCSLAS